MLGLEDERRRRWRVDVIPVWARIKNWTDARPLVFRVLDFCCFAVEVGCASKSETDDATPKSFARSSFELLSDRDAEGDFEEWSDISPCFLQLAILNGWFSQNFHPPKYINVCCPGPNPSVIRVEIVTCTISQPGIASKIAVEPPRSL